MYHNVIFWVSNQIVNFDYDVVPILWKKWPIFIYWMIQLEGNLELETQFLILKFQLILWIKNFEEQILHTLFLNFEQLFIDKHRKV
jgi:hypothetical protein